MVLMAVRTSASSLPVKVPPAARVRSLLRSSSQHSSSCVTTSVPVNFVPALYSFQRVTKSDHSSLVPASDTDGRFSLSAFGFVAGAVDVALCVVACMLKGKQSQCLDHMGLTELIKSNNFQQQSYF